MGEPKKDQEGQREKFIDTARELGCDESEEAFDAKLRRIAKAPPPDRPAPKRRKNGASGE